MAWSACLAPSLRRYQFILLGEQRHMCVNNLLRVVREADRPGLEPATYWLQVRRPNHCATTPHCSSVDLALTVTAPLLTFDLQIGHAYCPDMLFSCFPLARAPVFHLPGQTNLPDLVFSSQSVSITYPKNSSYLFKTISNSYDGILILYKTS